MTLEIGWIDSWQLRDKKDVHPSHKMKVVCVKSLLNKMESVYNVDDFIKLRKELGDDKESQVRK